MSTHSSSNRPISAICQNIFPEISSFLEIIDLIDGETLLVLDIDETVLEYTEINRDYWFVLFSTHFEKLNNYDKAEAQAEKEWQTLVKESRPKHTDQEGINLLLQKIMDVKAELFFLTARTSEMIIETISHFKELGLPKNAIIYYDADNKGARLKEIIGKKQLKDLKIIFVDDLDRNLISVKETFDDKVRCFKFKKF